MIKELAGVVVVNADVLVLGFLLGWTVRAVVMKIRIYMLDR